jgi:outer membrane lipoprotein-sorting protein
LFTFETIFILGIFMKKAVVIGWLALAVLGGCASPTVVKSKQTGDSEMTCAQMQGAYAEAQEFEEKARKERGVTGTNVAAAIFFWPAMIGTYKNTEEAIDAAKERQKHLEKVAATKSCTLS